MLHISLHLHARLFSPPGSRMGSSRTTEMWNNLSQSRPFLLESSPPGAARGWREALWLFSDAGGKLVSLCRF